MIKSCKKPPVYFPTVTGAICSFNSQYAGLPLKSCVSQIQGYQEGSGTPSPSNVRNLVSFNSATLTENGNTHLFTFGTDIYSGSIDWLKGVVTATHVLKDLGAINWDVYNPVNKFIYTRNTLIPSAKPTANNNVRADMLCEIYPTLSRAEIKYSAPFETGIAIDQNGELIISDQNSTWTTMQEAINDLNGKYVCYELATPITIHLGGMEINTILGLNSLSSSVGTISAEYLKAGR